MKQPHIVVIGSLNMDLVISTSRMPKLGETITGQQMHTIPGGKGANQAVGCSRLGAKVSMVGAVGNDSFGKQIISQLGNYGVDVHPILVSDAPTGSAIIFHTPEDNCIVIIPGANELCDAELVSNFESLIYGADLLLVQLEIPLNSVYTALKIAREAGVCTVLNPAPARELSVDLLKLVDYLTPNETEFELLSGATYKSEDDLYAGMMKWQQEYGPKLFVTRGKNGVSYLLDGSLRTVDAPKVEVVDTTGAGDCFNAAFSCCLASGQSVADAAAFAVKAASLSVTKFGAQNGMPSMEDMRNA
ncbi:ribokinase [Paenibacillus psychroresistens]|uniref:Ribokinase n=1 Tax=Paenibacillus psychroresistens TaxID=1778678 RepID=A0A6B8RGK2_9BACL|nr:ribokinase [Paenibacillus psychroresistens]QGQ95229.1 ribokinase [Paenibacillus psychroresistens]